MRAPKTQSRRQCLAAASSFVRIVGDCDRGKTRRVTARASIVHVRCDHACLPTDKLQHPRAPFISGRDRSCGRGGRRLRSLSDRIAQSAGLLPASPRFRRMKDTSDSYIRKSNAFCLGPRRTGFQWQSISNPAVRSHSRRNELAVDMCVVRKGFLSGAESDNAWTIVPS
jgi:hypothetical protein